jgi:integrase
MALTNTAVTAAKPRTKPYKLSDERGLYLLVKPTGARLWRLKYRYDGREKLLALGQFPDVPLAQARDAREAARKLIAAGADPSAAKQSAKLAQADSFEAVAREWLEKQRGKLGPATYEKRLKWLESRVFPWIGKRPIAQIDAPDLLAVLRRIESKGRHETAHRVRALCGNIFRYAIATGRASRDPSADLRGALTPFTWKPRAAITVPSQVGELLRKIDAYQGQPATMAALKLAPLLFVRPGELRAAEWSEFSLDGREPVWRIPAARMKMRREHLVPLAPQTVTILRELEPITGGGRYVFPSLRGGHRPLSENTLNVALRSLGYDGDTMTAHGFRAMASTILNEQGFPPDVIELQLAHKERNEVRAAYNRAQRLTERRKMMIAWADYLDGLRASTNVVNLKARA